MTGGSEVRFGGVRWPWHFKKIIRAKRLLFVDHQTPSQPRTTPQSPTLAPRLPGSRLPWTNCGGANINSVTWCCDVGYHQYLHLKSGADQIDVTPSSPLLSEIVPWYFPSTRSAWYDRIDLVVRRHATSCDSCARLIRPHGSLQDHQDNSNYTFIHLDCDNDMASSKIPPT